MPATFVSVPGLDRCDRCGARAQVRAVFGERGELLFCGHHFRQHENRLVDLAAIVRISRAA
jgi:hypothetical protein